jgi:hypothetical protein
LKLELSALADAKFGTEDDVGDETAEDPMDVPGDETADDRIPEDTEDGTGNELAEDSEDTDDDAGDEQSVVQVTA